VNLAIHSVEQSYIYATDFDDFLDFSAADSTQRAILYGYAGDDTLIGGAADDTLDGGDGNDTLNGGDGNDFIEGGEGDEEINGGGGNDRIWGDYYYTEVAGSTDILRGGAGDDEMYGGAGNDTLIDTEGNNSFFGGTGVDSFIAGDGNDLIEGGEGDEEINGGGGNDRIWGDYIYSEIANSTDTLRGGAGDDEIYGGAGDDMLYGNAGNDYLYGGSDNDQLQGTDDGRGETDYLRGDQGNDRFILGTDITSFYDDGNSPLSGSNGYAYLYDFDPAVDTIQLYGDALRYSLESSGTETRIYIFEPNGIPADLIAIVAGQTGLNLESPYFSYAGYSGITNGGRASFSLSGTVAVNNTVAAVLVSPDPDGNGPFAYEWQSASVGGTWWPLLHTRDSYTIPSREEGRQLRVAITYTDNKGFPEGLFLDAGVIPLYNDGPAVFAIGGTVAVGQTLSALLQASDPDGNGTFAYQWQTSSDGTTWLTVGSEETYTVASADQGKQLRLAVTYTDAQNFDEVVSVAAGTVPIPPPPDIDLRVVALDTVTITESPLGDLEAIATLNQMNPARSLTAIGIDNSTITLGSKDDLQGTAVRIVADITSIGAPATAIGIDRSRLLLRPGDDTITIAAQISGVAGTPSVAMRNSFLSANRGDDQITLQGDLWGDRALIYAGDGNDHITAYGIGRDSFIQAGPGDDWISLGRLETTPGAAPLDRLGNDPIAVSTYRGGAGIDTLHLRDVSQAEFSAEAIWFTSPGENGWQFRGARFSGFENYTFG
ncbi:MAG: calcium-binding protein, partial [Synechococcaceae cyanobacterium]|nr:calcium-binding protein [Synechococcaceae cyanobacterium]